MADPASFQSLDDGHTRVPWKSGASDIHAPEDFHGWNLRLSSPGEEEHPSSKRHHVQVLCHVNLWGCSFSGLVQSEK